MSCETCSCRDLSREAELERELAESREVVRTLSLMSGFIAAVLKEEAQDGN